MQRIRGSNDAYKFGGIKVNFADHFANSLTSNSVHAQSTNLNINATFDSTITSDPNATAIQSTINAVIALYESKFSDPVTINITFANMNTGLGQSSWYYDVIPYATWRGYLAASASTNNDTTALANVPSGSTDPILGHGSVYVKTANYKALTSTSSGSTDGTISVNMSICNLDRITIDSNKYDLYSVLCHELDEILGMGSSLDGLGNLLPEDLFRYSANGVRSRTTSSSATSYFSIDGGATNLIGFNQSGGGSDFGDWIGGGTHHVQDAYGTPGVIVNPNIEFEVLDVLGYHYISGASNASSAATSTTNVRGSSNVNSVGSIAATSATNMSSHNIVSGEADASSSSTSSIQGGSHANTEAAATAASIATSFSRNQTSHNVVVNEITASFTDNSPVNLGSAVVFTNTSIGNANQHWDFGDSSGTSTTASPSYTYSSPGDYTVTLSINNSAEEVNNTVTVNQPLSYVWDKINLQSYFNDIGFVNTGFDSSGYPSGYGLDGSPSAGHGGNLMSFDLIGGTPQTFGGIGFNMPVNPDNLTNNIIYCDGQVIPLSGGMYTNLELLAFITNASSRTVDFVITYSDSSTTTVTQQISDWTIYNGFEHETIALTMNSRLNNVGGLDGTTCRIYRYDIPLDSTKNLVSITLPVQNNTFIVSITQASLVAGPACWIKADALTLGNNNSVSTWNDISGNSNDFTQPNDFQPTYHTNVINGLPAVQFDGTSSYMQTSITAPNKYSVFAVYKQLTTGNFSIAVSWGSGSSGKTFWSGYISGTPNSGHLIPASDSSVDNYSSSADDTNWHVVDGVFDGTHLIGHDYGTLATPSINQTSGNLSSNNVTLGGYGHSPSLYWNGYVAEVLLFTTNISDEYRALIQSYLTYKYDLQPQNEIQQFSFSPAPISGTYKITVNGHQTSDIPFDADATNIQAYINTALNANNVSVS